MKQNKNPRRRILHAALAGIFATGCMAGAAVPEPQRPNLVFIMTDDQAYDALGFKDRYPWLKTPNIDRLAAEGATFDNFFVSTALCSPSRAAILTGAYGHKNGVTYNEQGDPILPTFPLYLQKAGYETAYVGKWHMQPHARPRPGFDYWMSFRAQGQYFDPPVNINGEKKTVKGYTTDILTDYAQRWLQTGRDSEKPFCLFLMHKANHGPFSPAPRHKDAWPDATLERPLSSTYDMSDRPAWQRHASTYGVHNKPFHENRDKPTPERIAPGGWNPKNKVILDHLRCILAVDESVGRIYETLRQTGELDNTLLVFTSDNGFFLGEHRRSDKRLAYEESIRVPFCARFPKMIPPGTRIDASCMNIDVAPTFFELAGLPPLEQFQGRSLVPVFSGRTPDSWRKYIFYEYFQERYAPGIPTMLAVRNDRWKYIDHPDLKDDIDELYDLQDDPREMKNLFLNPEYSTQLEQMRKLLRQAEKEVGYDTPIPPQY
ncbi:MAG: sulfatase [Verrucomicrobiota bacterium]|nr:sulfatase [Verrucomicrobiota bacterium]